MGRAIKFRAWDKKNKKMLYPLSGIIWGKPIVPYDYALGVFDYQLPSNYSFFSDEMVTVDDCEIMLCVGLEDKNGREIFQGDLLKTNRGLFEVFYREEYAGFYCKQGDWIDLLASSGTKGNLEWHEVIGDIYQNAALLTI